MRLAKDKRKVMLLELMSWAVWSHSVVVDPLQWAWADFRPH